jgi:hypothetical protein
MGSASRFPVYLALLLGATPRGGHTHKKLNDMVVVVIVLPLHASCLSPSPNATVINHAD